MLRESWVEAEWTLSWFSPSVAFVRWRPKVSGNPFKGLAPPTPLLGCLAPDILAGTDTQTDWSIKCLAFSWKAWVMHDLRNNMMHNVLHNVEWKWIFARLNGFQEHVKLITIAAKPQNSKAQLRIIEHHQPVCTSNLLSSERCLRSVK